MKGRLRRASRGFMLLEVLAALAIALLLMVPVASMIGGAAGTVAAIERSAARQQSVQAAALAAALVALPGESEQEFSGFIVSVETMPLDNKGTETQAGWSLHRVAVRAANGNDAGPLIETIRISGP